jgi:ABC-type oligopeptide transport system substrate-binding subunit
MHQVPEIARVGPLGRPGAYRHLLRRSVIFAVVMLLMGCDHHNPNSGNAPDAPVNRTLRRGIPGEPRSLDPQLADDDFSFQVVRDLFEGLTAEDPWGHVAPGVASSWAVDESGTIYTFHLRPDAKWSNGDRIVAAEFVEGLRRAVNPQTASGSAGLLAVVKGASDIIAGRSKPSNLRATALDESTVRVELEHPAPYILQVLSQPIAAPVYLGSQSSSASSQPDGTNRGTGSYNGAYVLVRRVPGSFIELARNPYYWNTSKVRIQTVRYVNAESPETELREYTAGQLDMTFTIPMPDLSRIIQKYGSEVQMAPILGTVYLALNLSTGPLKSSLELRQALAMAVDKDQIAEHVMMGVMPAYSFVANGISNYDPPIYEWANWSREHQLTYARSLYQHAGYSEENPLHLKLYFNNGEGIQRIMVAIAGSWKQNLGVVSDLTGEEFRVFLAGRKDRSRWDVARLGWDADYDDPSSFLELFSSGSNQNDPDYNSAAFNELIARARVEAQPDRRIILLRQAEQVLLSDYPIVPIYFSRGRRLVKPYVGGAHITPMHRTYTKNLYWLPG